ncbi:hypothetical protein N9231_06295, partial [Saprospiraceae bacterium]|nr:hypothetical protein [Saprospiraceae bacterium]
MALQQPKSILKDKPIAPSMDFSFLKKEGIEEIQRISGRIWTDYNEHDPGVTILENLCYALTELGYKTHFSIQDLFFKKTDENDQDFLKTFYGPKEILPPSPSTILDFRRLLIDNITAIKNIWIIPKKQSVIGTRINGLYEVLVLVDESNKDKDRIEVDVQSILQSNRNLGEDFEEIKILDFEPIHFSASVSISPDAIGESIYAEILTKIQESFSPIIPLYSEDEMLDMGFDYEYLHDHPPVQNGYVIEEDLLNSELHHVNKLFKSNLIRIISEIDGVEEVFDFALFIKGVQVQSEIIQLDEYKIPNLETEKIISEQTISLVAGDITYNPDREVVRYTFDIEKSRSSVKHKRYIDKNINEINSNLEKEEIETYYSIQNSFPRTYGITDFGIQGKVSSERKAQVNQLRSYLFFFEQIMANYLSQLANVDKLFSTKKDLEHTYFYQHLTHVNGYKDIIKSYNGTGNIPLDKINSKFDRADERRNKLLDHMLARFGEEFLLEAYNAIHRESSSIAKTNFLDQSIKAKNTFLNNYLEISSNKAKGFDYSSDYLETENVSGIEKKISLLFNFD